MANEQSDYPVTFWIDYPERTLDRMTTFFRLILVIPIGIVASLLPSATNGFGSLIMFPVALMLLFRRKYPRWWFDWNLEMTRFLMRIETFALVLRDEYPSTDDQQAVHLEIAYPARGELKAKLDRGDNFKLIMVLGPWQFDAKHIPGSLHITSVERALELLTPDDEIVVYCSNPACGASMYACWRLTDAGLPNVRRFAGGVADWEAAGYPLEGWRGTNGPDAATTSLRAHP